MKFTTAYRGANDPFEGDCTLWLRSLPDKARVKKATLALTPVAPFNGTKFTERFVFNSGVGADELDAGKWGVSKTLPGAFVEVDFHARRMPASVEGSGPASTLQVDMGGVFVGIADDGTFMTPEKSPFPVNLSASPVALPGLVVNKFRLNRAVGNANNLDVTKVTIRSVPTNVSIRLGQMAPFWTRLGELTSAETSPDFAAVLNAFLFEASVENGFYVVPFVIHSDTIARLDVDIRIDYLIEQPVLPPEIPEVNLPFGFSTMPGIDEAVMTVKLPREAVPVSGRTGGRIQGVFESTRVAHGDIGDVVSTNTVKVSPDCSLAQPVQSDKEIAVTGIDLPLANTMPGLAGLNITIQKDADGKPSGDVLSSAEVRVEKPLPDQSSWGSSTLPAEFRILPGVCYWLILQSVSGDAYWNALPGEAGKPALQCSRDGGLSWRSATMPDASAPLAALFRLRDTPERFSVPVQLQVGKGSDSVRAHFDRFAPLGKIEFDLDFSKELGQHLESPAVASPCGKGNLLKNSNFSDPPHDDATRKLFGFDSDYGVEYSSIVGTVDLSRGVNLSVERFITLAVTDNYGGYIDGPKRIDCAGEDPSHTSLDEIIVNINSAMESAQPYDGNFADKVVSGESQFLKLNPYPANVVIFQWCRIKVPSAWKGEPGLIRRLKMPDAKGRMLTVLGDISQASIDLPCFSPVSPASGVPVTEPAIISQRVQVASDCAYLFQFFFWAAAMSLSIPPRWEVIWFNEDWETLRTEGETIEIENRKHNFVKPSISRSYYEVRVTAAPDAAFAEIRFIQPLTGVIGLESVSFSPTLETVGNGTFTQYDEDEPLKWQLLNGWINRTNQGLLLNGAGPDDAVITQTAKIIAGERYELKVCARMLSTPLDDPDAEPEQRGRLELYWLDDGPIGEPVILPLDGRGFPTHVWTGDAPDGVTMVEIHLVQPQGNGELEVESVSLRRVDLVDVPLIFLAEAPGELTVSNLRVAYDQKSTGQPFNQSQRERSTIQSTLKRNVQTSELSGISSMREAAIKESESIMSAELPTAKISTKTEDTLKKSAEATEKDIELSNLSEEKQKQVELAAAILKLLNEPFLTPLLNYKLNTILNFSTETLYKRLKKR